MYALSKVASAKVRVMKGSSVVYVEPMRGRQVPYTYSIVKGDLELINEQPHTWFHCLVRSHKSDFTTYMGSLRFEGEDFTFWDRFCGNLCNKQNSKNQEYQRYL